MHFPRGDDEVEAEDDLEDEHVDEQELRRLLRGSQETRGRSLITRRGSLRMRGCSLVRRGCSLTPRGRILEMRTPRRRRS